MTDAKWVEKALSKDTTRPYLTVAFRESLFGDTWLCATDGHRAHMVRSNGETGHIHPVDAPPPKMSELIAQHDTRRQIGSISVDRLRVASSMAHADGCIDFSASGSRCAPACNRDPSDMYVRLNARYVRDVLSGVPRRLKGFPSVYVHVCAPDQAVLFTSHKSLTDSVWIALVMPVRI
jgi:hypothetical protein